MQAFAKKSGTTTSPASTNKGRDDFFGVQAKLSIGKADDKYEREADHTAGKVVQKLENPFRHYGHTPFFAAAPVVQKKEFRDEKEPVVQERPVAENITPLVQKQPQEEQVQEKKEEEIQKQEEEESLQKQSRADDGNTDENTAIQAKTDQFNMVPPKMEHDLRHAPGGQAMNTTTRSQMESGFGVDFSDVRIHTDHKAVQMNQKLGAQAFTHGNDIYFNEGKYNPSSSSGKHLLAHELTHTVQQGGVVNLKPLDIGPAPQMVQGFGIVDVIPDWVIDRARHIPGYTLFTVIIEYDPLLDRTVERTPINLIEGLMGLVPFGTAIFDKLQEYGIIQRVFDWVKGQLNSLNLTTQGLLDLLEEAWDELEFPFRNAIEVITDKFQHLVNRIETFATSLIDQLITWIKEVLIDVAEPILEENRAWSLIKKIIRYDPLRDEEVNASTVEILEDFLLLIDKQTELEQMKERGTLQETADWLDTQVGTFMSLLGELRGLITAVWDAIQPENLPNIVENLQALAGRATGFLQRVWDFATTVATQVLELIKNALLGWLNSFAADIPGFTLLTVILGKNPLTEEKVLRSVENIIRGFMGLVPGGEAKYQELKQSGVIPRAAGQIEALIEELGFSWDTIVQLFTDIWNSLSIEDLIDPLGAFERIAAQFEEPISRLFRFVMKVVKVLVELILEIMGIPPEMIAGILANAMQAFTDIKNDPIGFLLNLMNAVKKGFLNFLNNIGTHLLNGLQNWLFGTLADAGIQIPDDMSLRSIMGMAMDVLGITVDNILERLALRIGEERVAQIRSVLDTLSGLWAFVRDVIERGPIAIWEYIQGQISNLWNIIQDGIMGFIQEKVIQQAITWLLSFLDVTGIMPVIRGVQTVFNAIASFIEKLREILGIINSFVAGVADIARGNIQTAAGFLENALADGIPIAISFLAKQLGLGDISEKIEEMIENARGMINEGIDWLIDRAMAAGTAFLNMLGMGGENTPGEDPRNDEQKREDLNLAINQGNQILRRDDLTYEEKEEHLDSIKTQYNLTSLEIITDSTRDETQIVHLEAVINPRLNGQNIEIDFERAENEISWPPINLNSHEHKGGHTLARHVSPQISGIDNNLPLEEKQEIYATSRIWNENTQDPRSVWTSKSTAERIISQQISRFRNSIIIWLLDETDSGRLRLNYQGNPGNVIGKSLMRIDNQIETFDVWDARIILEKQAFGDKKSFYILTSFPED
ncbi:DUF4157 domain-containing protein [Sinomicrobium pectinilyticum]|uniref:DUF4157 domain-containing protein n=1 Tax=Sinomicrobium pectinilyticum TaxID=1084421 RepID=A0A3N0EVJ0_SINP1|nr:DUF4157 domain-containing protein [Sinomicrobium pectinilyticum]RNL91729.1 DUF4157 domain-containing protein [Sinomicrobium pectinilyticum]